MIQVVLLQLITFSVNNKHILWLIKMGNGADF